MLHSDPLMVNITTRHLFFLLACSLVVPWASAQDVDRQGVAASPDEAAIRQRLESCLDAFNRHDASAVGAFWALDGVSLAEDSGERVSGREALVRQFSKFFEQIPTARLSGELTEVKLVRPDVAMIDGRTTLFAADGEPVVSVFAALLVKEGGRVADQQFPRARRAASGITRCAP